MPRRKGSPPSPAAARIVQARFANLRKATAKLLKLGALVRVSVRRVKFAMASGCPWQNEWALAHARLRNAAAA